MWKLCSFPKSVDSQGITYFSVVILLFTISYAGTMKTSANSKVGIGDIELATVVLVADQKHDVEQKLSGPPCAVSLSNGNAWSLCLTGEGKF
ncbi:MAG: hypothetical protein NPIRA05_11680 [Nitrospirales bacterium]|nr:MAG: hypothetical protein NPIRA05_11680 [Nitrospirales bacterium]